MTWSQAFQAPCDSPKPSELEASGLRVSQVLQSNQHRTSRRNHGHRVEVGGGGGGGRGVGVLNYWALVRNQTRRNLDYQRAKKGLGPALCTTTLQQNLALKSLPNQGIPVAFLAQGHSRS